MDHPPITGKAVAGFFLVCTLGDFILGYAHGRTLYAAIARAFFGLFSTFAFLGLWWLWSRKDRSGD
jgi:hypothetical protein